MEGWMNNQDTLTSKLIQSYDGTEESRKATEHELFGQVIVKSIAKISNGEIKEERKTEIQQRILNAKRREARY